MTFEMFTALIGFAFVMSISPGPGNFLLLASGANFGFWRTLPLVFGISGGFLTMVLVIGLGFGEILKTYSIIYQGLRFLCIAYVLWLAWKIAQVKSLGPEETEPGSTPIGFFQAATLQLLNPKAWAVALIVTVSYTSPDNYVSSLIWMLVTFAVVNIPSISVWALGGTALRQFLRTEKRVRIFNVTMALLLVAAMIPVLLGTVSI